MQSEMLIASDRKNRTGWQYQHRLLQLEKLIKNKMVFSKAAKLELAIETNEKNISRLYNRV